MEQNTPPTEENETTGTPENQAENQPETTPQEEQPVSTPQNEYNIPNNIEFMGEGTELLGITLLNMVLTSLTLGLYYPWARVARLRFFYQNAFLNGTPFVFSGNGKELFKGFIKVFVLFIALYAGLIAVTVLRIELLTVVYLLFYFAAIIVLIPLAIHSALRYRLSRTSWRGIHFGYRGDRGRLILDFIIGYLLSSFTLGIYQSWFVNKLRTYLIGNMRFGSIYFGYDGDGGEVFWINFKGFVLSMLTFGIYYFWYRTEYLNYFIRHTYMEQNGKRFYLNVDYSGSEFFGLMVVNTFLTLFTFGFGTPFAAVRTARFIVNNMEIPAELDLENIAQTEDDYRDASGDDLLDAFDIGIA